MSTLGLAGNTMMVITESNGRCWQLLQNLIVNTAMLKSNRF